MYQVKAEYMLRYHYHIIRSYFNVTSAPMYRYVITPKLCYFNENYIPEPRSNRRMVKWLNCDFISRDFALAVIPQRPFSRQLERERGGEIKRTKKKKKEEEEEEEEEEKEKEKKEEGETFLSPPAPVPLPTPPPLYHARKSTGEWLEKCEEDEEEEDKEEKGEEEEEEEEDDDDDDDGWLLRPTPFLFSSSSSSSALFGRKNDERTTDGRRGVWRKGEKGEEGREETRCTHTKCSLMGEESVPGKQAVFSIETMDQAHYNFYDRKERALHFQETLNIYRLNYRPAAEEPCARVSVHVNPAARRESTLYNMVHDTRNIQHETRIENTEHRSQITFTNHSMQPMNASL
ncbi:hypothetical protein V1478_002988, partial [Vespula squamosa]